MSCFVINNKTASSIVTALIELNYIHNTEAQCFLNMVMDLNDRAYYSGYKNEDEIIFTKYNFIKQNTNVSQHDEHLAIMQMIVNIACYFYQVCGFDGYQETLVYKTLKIAQDEMLNHFKEWLIENHYYTREEVKNKMYYELPFSSKMQWELS
ncbi:hypothetical protein [Xenorhabdus ishibashii]|uniref:Uncharacterized protein n=1 Tax=Xenorhabdus ishibashii TaxID=1034471 RepID=A0A2D0K7X4_9GAMM|nr:hypothetical protein [Xenorhabdus ishibashii]PHM59544.1 hypothetical protein Xish_03663 [Xenorhabdus ishibashii]